VVAGDARSRRVLIADDSRLVSRFLRNILTEQGYEVTEAANGVDAL
jgi:CheY-like chemotaxis protein